MLLDGCWLFPILSALKQTSILTRLLRNYSTHSIKKTLNSIVEWLFQIKIIRLVATSWPASIECFSKTWIPFFDNKCRGGSGMLLSSGRFSRKPRIICKSFNVLFKWLPFLLSNDALADTFSGMPVSRWCDTRFPTECLVGSAIKHVII